MQTLVPEPLSAPRGSPDGTQGGDEGRPHFHVGWVGAKGWDLTSDRTLRLPSFLTCLLSNLDLLISQRSVSE